jgi:hypothetical protein
MHRTTTTTVALRALDSFVTKYLSTWSLLLRTPSAFLKLSLEDKRKQCTAPWTFFVVSVALVPLIFEPLLYIGLRLASLPPPLDVSISILDVGDGRPYRSGVNAIIVAIIWYTIFIKLLKVKPAIRTTTPGRRIFYELLYIYAGPNQLLSYASITAGLLLLFVTARVMAQSYSPVPDTVLADVLVALLALVFLALILLFPFIIIPLYYDVLLATTLLTIPKLRACIICCGISLLTVIPLGAMALWDGYLLPCRLSNQERGAVDCLFSIARLESIYRYTKPEGIPLDKLIGEISPLGLNRGETGGFAPDDIKNIQLLQAGEFSRYSFLVHLGKLPYFEAIPRAYGQETRYSFLVLRPSDPDTLISGFGGDHRGGSAEVSDRRLLPSVVMSYK